MLHIWIKMQNGVLKDETIKLGTNLLTQNSWNDLCRWNWGTKTPTRLRPSGQKAGERWSSRRASVGLQTSQPTKTLRYRLMGSGGVSDCFMWLPPASPSVLNPCVLLTRFCPGILTASVLLPETWSMFPTANVVLLWNRFWWVLNKMCEHIKLSQWLHA